MLVRIAQLRRVGRFTTFDHRTADEVRFRRLTSLFARNGSGKSTIARVLDAAGRSDIAGLLDHATLDESQPPEVTLLFEAGGNCRFDGAAWSGTPPRVRVFDRDFVEANVFVGKSLNKGTRASLLELALGADAVASKNLLDDLSAKGRQLTSDMRPHVATLRAAVAAARLSEDDFIALAPVEDEETERSRLQARERDAITAVEIRKRARPALLPDLPGFDFQRLQEVLGRGAMRIGDEAEADVRSHLDGRLGGRAQAWVRDGLAYDDGATCPYCGQDLEGVELVRHYRAYFDKAWDKLAADLDEAARVLDGLDRWWDQVKQVGRENLAAFGAWEDVTGVERPDFDSPRRKEALDAAKASLSEVISTKKGRLDQSVDGAHAVSAARAALSLIAEALATYNVSVRAWLDGIDARLTQLDGLSVDVARRDLQLLDARVQRHGANVKHALAERSRLDAAKAENDRLKGEAEAALRSRSEVRLEAFGKRINELLGDLCADFRVEKLGTERVGGAAAARFTLTVDLGGSDVRELAVANKEGEARLARVLSDGDRSSLALAVFLASLEDDVDLADRVIVFDDPMTSLDLKRSEATAEKVADVARAARQVLVLSHHAPFLAQVAHAWARFGEDGDLADIREVELARGTRTVEPWRSEDHVAHEHVRRWREIRAFVEDPTLDGQSRHIHGEIRAFLEGYVRLRWPDLFTSPNQPLEPVVRSLKSNPSLREAKTSMTAQELDALDRLCGFGAPGNHSGSHREVQAPDPDAVRARARKALEYAR